MDSDPFASSRAVVNELGARLRRAREIGVPFRVAWDVAVEQSLRLAGPEQQRDWEVALRETRPRWEASYRRRPDAKVAMFARLAAYVDDESV